MNELEMWKAYVAALSARARQPKDEQGLASETIWAAGMGAGALVVLGIIVAKMTGAANGIPLP